MAQAQTAEKEIQRGHYRGPLHGIPYAAKDLLAVKGVPCTWGAKLYANQTFNYDATLIEHLNRVGAVLIGKAAMIELAGGMGYRFASASLQGETKNPWDTKCWTCGSSSGSGAVVAAGLAAFAIGTETWGSIICPSAFCGVSGLRPTYGRVSRHGAMALSPSMDKIGPLARSAEDCARVFAAIAGHDPRDRSTLPFDKAAFTYSASLELKARKLKVGWLTNAWKKMEPGVAKAAGGGHASGNQPRDATRVSRSPGRHRKSVRPSGTFRSLRLHRKESSRGTAIHGARRRRHRGDSGRARLSTAHRLAPEAPENCLRQHAPVES